MRNPIRLGGLGGLGDTGYHAPMIEKLNDLLAPSGMFVRGGFLVEEGEAIPVLPGGRPTATVLLVGNAGTAMWEAFERDGDRTLRHPLDSWLRPRIEDAAAAVDAHPLFPNDGPPFIPVQDWAMRAEPVYRSPLGILIHPDFGLWHVYRAVLLLAEVVDLPARREAPSPCESCEKKPCLTVCPADAFLPDSFDAPACAAHVESDAGTACRDRGCLARRACPVGRDRLYGPAQQAFHTAAMLAAVKSGFGAES